MSSGRLLTMGDFFRDRVLRALGLSRVWVELSALSARLQRMEHDHVSDRARLLRLEADVVEANPGGSVAASMRPPAARPRTIPASPPPPPSGSAGDPHAHRMISTSTSTDHIGTMLPYKPKGDA